MVQRTRISRSRRHTGFIRNVTGEIAFTNSANQSVSHCVDHAFEPPFRDQDLDIQHVYRAGGFLNGTRTETGDVWQEFPPEGLPLPTPPNPIDSYRPSDGALMVSLLAKTNPSNAAVSIPNFIWEMRELPSLMLSKLLRGGLLKSSANSYLAYEFGVKPLIDDIKSMVDFAAETHKRVILLKKLASGKSLIRKVDLFRATEKYTNQSFIHLSSLGGNTSTEEVDVKYTEKIWGYAKYSSDPSLLPQTDEGMTSLATRVALGLTIDSSTVWEALPWSWLVDWYGNVGEVLEANRNLIPATLDVAKLCHTTFLDQTLRKVKTEKGLKFTPYVENYIRKRRYHAMPAFEAKIPVFTNRQFSILSAINIQRWRR